MRRSCRLCQRETAVKDVRDPGGAWLGGPGWQRKKVGAGHKRYDRYPYTLVQEWRAQGAARRYKDAAAQEQARQCKDGAAVGRARW